ncbi:dethiobiotin synthase [Leptospira gomenensis]|uniref:ATP-dependent dethiobiotin synthetase BioD n=1 Tax=Leptospira gomenensis TaxID=2484974 RepID=A0A5F1YSV1_9LEPT|nr:dethiobiotin synthase [Leptospira gomenensis]TGK35169.1 dethiobiotin synthase [Leptospira gomenensis]TGK35876.1 dethiobiotin synthase [Leptospira gomenensis]TGK41031.1 dethiobiotin synthase [Leptospira gomenensis]TGK61260.1 dethiobiotin synthase [Leptospira gomenensis]
MAVFISATGTDVGKSFFSALLMAKYGDSYGLKYFKPIQTGSEDDRAAVQGLTGLPESSFLKNYYSFSFAGSPHYASELEKIPVDTEELVRHLYSIREERIVIEGAGGLLVPLTRSFLTIDLIQKSEIPLVLVVPVSLGAINHSLLSLEAIQKRNIDCKGIYFLGTPDDTTEDNVRTILEWSGAKFLGSFFFDSKERLSREKFTADCVPRFDSDGLLKDLFL